ncbi:hypothetical protein [Pseudocolwellia agarivorans]|uniref:hypothetical protein n=1 Tax=Pseudocolwellia agarivorans TaxID=1911682 RepID=UPI0009877307|nr:hypothetical protein [Pseudocolwellia agarivorans]
MSTEKKFNLETLRQAMREACETNDIDHYIQGLYGPTDEQLDAEHEEEFRLFMDEVDLAKRLSLVEFLGEVVNPDYVHNLVDEPPKALVNDIYRLYTEWCKLADMPTLNEKTFLHGLYLFGFVSENWHIGIEGITGIGIVETDTEIRLNLVPNCHAELN